MARLKASHCVRGHEFNRRNTHTRKDGSRVCLRCHAERERFRYWADDAHRERKLRRMEARRREIEVAQ